MNNKFYELPKEKQNRIKYAGYKVFGENSYSKASMKNLADEAGISKALVFHYFKNKMTLYQWLFQEALKELNVMNTIDLSGSKDFFELIHEVMVSRLLMMEQLQEVYQFVNRAFAKSIEEGHGEILETIRTMTEKRKKTVLSHIDQNKFKDPSQISLLYDLINDLGIGYYYRTKATGMKSREDIKPFIEYVDSLRQCYYKEAYL